MRTRICAGRLSRPHPPHSSRTVTGCGFEVLPNFWQISGKVLAGAMSWQTKHFYAFGPFRLDSEKRVLVRDGMPVPLAPKAGGDPASCWSRTPDTWWTKTT